MPATHLKSEAVLQPRLQESTGRAVGPQAAGAGGLGGPHLEEGRLEAGGWREEGGGGWRAVESGGW